MTDGPYEQTPEPFGAFFIIEADDMDEAVEVARLHPGTHLGANDEGRDLNSCPIETWSSF